MSELHRVPRNKVEEEIDLLHPIPLEKFGSEDDPCFGKHHSPKAEECRRCGDADICLIYTTQRLHLQRGKREAKQKFKDTEIFTEDRPFLEFVRSKLTEKNPKLAIEALVSKAKVSYYSEETKISEREITSLIESLARNYPKEFKVFTSKKNSRKYIKRLLF